MTSDEVLRDLRDIDWLIAALAAGHDEATDRDDLRWLRARRRHLAALLEVRSAQRGKKVVSLELWRCGRAAPPRRAARIA